MQVLVDNPDDFLAQQSVRLQVFVQVQQVQDVQQSVIVDIEDIEAQVELLRLVIQSEGQQEFNELRDRDLGSVETLSHP